MWRSKVMGIVRISRNRLPVLSNEIQSHMHKIDYYPLDDQLHSHGDPLEKLENLLLIF